MWKRPKIKHGQLTKWLWVVWHPENFILGERTDIGAFTGIFAHQGVFIGDDVQIGGGCRIYSLDTIGLTFGPVAIGKRARIGCNSTVMPGVTIGENALVAAHSFVNRDIPAGCFAYGCPIRIERRQNYDE